MRKVAILLSVVAAMLMIASGVALAKSFNGGAGNNRLIGTNAADNINGGGGDDFISGRGGNDRLNGDTGSDEIRGGGGRDNIYGNDGFDSMHGNSGNDYINAADNRGGEIVTCGSGNDFAVIDVDSNTGEFDGQNNDLTGCEDVAFVVTTDLSGNSAGGGPGTWTQAEAEAAVASGDAQPLSELE